MESADTFSLRKRSRIWQWRWRWTLSVFLSRVSFPDLSKLSSWVVTKTTNKNQESRCDDTSH